MPNKVGLEILFSQPKSCPKPIEISVDRIQETVESMYNLGSQSGPDYIVNHATWLAMQKAYFGDEK